MIDPEEIDAANTQAAADYDKIGWTEGIFKSFNDAPDGLSEELKEFTYSIGTHGC